MTTNQHRLVKINKSGGACACGLMYESVDGPIRTQHAEHKTELACTAPASREASISEAVRIDTELAEMWRAYYHVADRADAPSRNIAADRKMVRAGYDRDGHYTERIAKAEAVIEAIMVEARPLAEAARKFDAKHYTGWNRFFTVPDGHIHRSTSCHTLRATTRIGWTPNLSGRTEREAVEELGPTLCTVCFPSAPVEWSMGVKKDVCPGSAKYGTDWRKRYEACPDCGEFVSKSSLGKLRSHKSKEA